ncbi:hypothetical protein [Streptomyces sp. ST2-7A]|uniref:hypothetical protein n=1 Tax=Streptomyces sp. ST2-7A TaxID=2907214 RepID=UPI001F25C522|nr:hypothetical protein [Streptomyces sp. ST2-7A]MCE7081680.1 hypothetical protein [Streptomyces sp. ST2-7A]
MDHPSPNFSLYHNSPPPHAQDSSPEEGPNLMEFDAAIRKDTTHTNATDNRLLGQAFLHRPRVPLDRAPIDHVTAAERAALRGGAAEAEEMEDGVLDGCSPWACRGEGGAPTRDDFGLAS